MFEIKEYFNDRFYRVLISNEIINFSYPNKNYSQIAKSTFESHMNQIKLKRNLQLELLLENSKNTLFINAHAGEKNGSWVIYEDIFNYFEINNFLEEKIKKYDSDSCILYCCNFNNFKIEVDLVPILYPNQKISSFIKSDETFSLINK